ncbi:hypothetical protein MMC13_005737 [Lambiella insularis]|nr:hypothetical protein [Lambiella insularis]
MLEHQQTQLVNGLQELYTRVTTGKGWEAPLLDESSGKPLTHDILESLGILQQDSQSSLGRFEEDTDSIQKRLLRDGADMTQRRQSIDTECDQESIQSSFESAGHPSSVTTYFARAALPTPPCQSPEDSKFNCIGSVTHWPTLQKLTQVRPQSLQIHPGHNTWDIDLGSASRNWVESPNAYDNYVPTDCYPAFNGLDTTQSLAGNLPLPDWTEVDFNSFLNTTMT